jgi:hypothetical protein
MGTYIQRIQVCLPSLREMDIFFPVIKLADGIVA